MGHRVQCEKSLCIFFSCLGKGRIELCCRCSCPAEGLGNDPISLPCFDSCGFCSLAHILQNISVWSLLTSLLLLAATKGISYAANFLTMGGKGRRRMHWKNVHPVPRRFSRSWPREIFCLAFGSFSAGLVVTMLSSGSRRRTLASSPMKKQPWFDKLWRHSGIPPPPLAPLPSTPPFPQAILPISKLGADLLLLFKGYLLIWGVPRT